MLPQAPMPFQITQPKLPMNITSSSWAKPKAMYQARGGVGVSAMRDTLSVMRENMFARAGGDSYGFTSLIAMNQPCSDLEASAWASAGVRAGFVFLMRASYWTRGLLFSSPRSAYERGS